MSEPAKTPQEPDVDPEDVILAQMGYKQELRRGFDALMAVSFCFTAVAVMSSSSILFSLGLGTGGPAVMVWGWVVTSVFTILTGLAMAEICSTYPSAGSVYHWAGQLAPEAYAPVVSYVTGWFNFLGNAAGDASFAYGFADAVNSAYTVYHSDDALSVKQVVGISILISVVWALLNVLKVDQQGWLNNFAAVFQVVTSVGIVIALLATPKTRQPASFVFTSWENTTGFSSTGYVMLLGLLFSTFSFSGYEAGAHMAEETKNASKAAPYGIVATVLMVSVVGFMYILGLLFSTKDVAAAIDNGIVEVYTTACGRDGGFILAVLLIMNLFFAGVSSLTVTSRIGYAMARDGAFPGSEWIRVVNQRVQMPLRTVLLVLVADILILLIPLGSTVAFAAVTSITTIGFQVSYAIPILLRVTLGKSFFRQSEFSLGVLSVPVHWIAGIWLIVTSLVFFFPTETPITAQNMNYAVVVVGVVMAIGVVYWLFWARHFFRGPLRDSATVNDPAQTRILPSGSPTTLIRIDDDGDGDAAGIAFITNFDGKRYNTEMVLESGGHNSPAGKDSQGSEESNPIARPKSRSPSTPVLGSRTYQHMDIDRK